MQNKLLKIISKPSVLYGLIFLITLIVSLQNYLLTNAFGSFTAYNNYVIFKQSFFHLIHQQDLFCRYPAEYDDLYKYSPTFSLLMGPLAVLPNLVGLAIWNLLNVFVLLYALSKLPYTSQKNKLLAIAFVLIELITNIQASQSNGLMAGLLILTYTSLQSNKNKLAPLFIILAVLIKLFGIVAFVLFLFYPNKIKNIIYTLVWLLVLVLLPLMVVSPAQLIYLYKSWWHLLTSDYDTSLGFSVMAWLKKWFSIDAPKNIIVGIGAVLFCLPLIRIKQFSSEKFRLFFLSSVLIWVVIFNHKAESPTFIVATAGVAIWFFTQKFNWLNFSLLILTLLFTTLSPTDIFPRYLKEHLIAPYVLKAVPCIFVWCKVLYDLLTVDFIKPEIENKVVN